MHSLISPSDEAFLRQALDLAEQAIGLTDPNPRVGCVLTKPDGRVIGQGHTQRAGEAHAEVMALRSAASQGESASGATAYVTLEPCAHHGRTPPCCDALIQAGVRRVVVALRDPNPQVAGEGIRRMQAAGLDVLEIAPGPLAEAAHDLNIGFFSRMQRGRPWVRLKVAVSLDGRTALDNGRSQWITGPEARTDGHAWRKRAGAVLTGIGTVRADDPRLDVRLVPSALQPLRVVLDSDLSLPLTAQLLEGSGRVLVYTRPGAGPASKALTDRGVEVAEVPQHPQSGRADLGVMLADLAQRGINELHVEAGATLNGALIREGCVDEYLVYLAPLLMGQGRGLADLGPFNDMAEGRRLEFRDIKLLGHDLRLIARPLP